MPKRGMHSQRRKMGASAMNLLFRPFSICRRLTGEIVVYRCFERLGDHRFFVQSADRLRLPIRDEDIRAHERQLWELFLESSPDERGKPHSTVEEAIAAFDVELGN